MRKEQQTIVFKSEQHYMIYTLITQKSNQDTCCSFSKVTMLLKAIKQQKHLPTKLNFPGWDKK